LGIKVLFSETIQKNPEKSGILFDFDQLKPADGDNFEQTA